MTDCTYCRLDGRSGCPIHCRYRHPVTTILVAGVVALVFAVLVAILAFGAVR